MDDIEKHLENSQNGEAIEYLVRELATSNASGDRKRFRRLLGYLNEVTKKKELGELLDDASDSPDEMPRSHEKEELLYCSFCGKSQREVKKLIAGPSVLICDECVSMCQDILSGEGNEKKSGQPPSCSFCGKGKDEYKELVAGPAVYICDQCVLDSLKLLIEGGDE